MEKLKVIYKVIKPFINKYTLVLLGFVLFMSFGEYSFFNRFSLQHSVSELEKEKKQYEDDIIKARLELKQLNTNKESIERTAREEYNMRKANEEVFVVKTLDADTIDTEKK